MQPKFQSYESGYGAELLCPRCESNYMHHEALDVFERSEDATQGLHFSVSGSKATVDTSLTGNPSRRRDGIKIKFWCEGCHGISIFSISQHKGCSLVDLVDTGENKIFDA